MKKVYAYRINVNEKLRENVQYFPFLNSKDKNTNSDVINHLKSKELNIKEYNLDNYKSLIKWVKNENKNKHFYDFFEEKIEQFNLENIITKNLIETAILDFSWKFENINFKKKKILSIGTGGGLELFFLRYKFPESEIYAVDWESAVNPKVLKGLNINFVEENIYSYLKKNDNSFDFIYSSHVLEHSSDIDQLLYLINKSLITDGILVSNLPLCSFPGTKYYNFLEKSLKNKEIKQIDGSLIDIGHAWKTNEQDLYHTLEKSKFFEINIYGNSSQVVRMTRVKMDKFIKNANLKFRLNSIFIAPFKYIINIIFGNNINYWVLKIFLRTIRNLSISDNKIAHYVPEIMFTAKKKS